MKNLEGLQELLDRLDSNIYSAIESNTITAYQKRIQLNALYAQRNTLSQMMQE